MKVTWPGYLRRSRRGATVPALDSRRRWPRIVLAGFATLLLLALASCAGGVAPDGWPDVQRLSWSHELVIHTLAWEIPFISALVVVALGWSVWRAARRFQRFDATLIPAGPDILALTDGVAPRQALFTLADERPVVLCVGFLRPKIALSVGALESLPPAALRAAVAHEEVHRQRRDPLRLLIVRSFASVLLPPALASAWSARIELRAEARADRHARQITSRAALASALYVTLRASTATEPIAPVESGPSGDAITAGRVDDTLAERLAYLAADDDAAPLPHWLPAAPLGSALVRTSLIIGVRALVVASAPALALVAVSALVAPAMGMPLLACAVHAV